MADTTNELELEVGDVFRSDHSRPAWEVDYEVLAFSKNRRSRTQRVLPDGEPYKTAPMLTPREVIDPVECLRSVREYLVETPAETLEGFRDPALAALGNVVVDLARDRANRRPPTEFQRQMAKSIGGVELP